MNKREKSPSLKELAGAPCPGIHREREGEGAERENHKKQKDGLMGGQEGLGCKMVGCGGCCEPPEFRRLAPWPHGQEAREERRRPSPGRLPVSSALLLRPVLRFEVGMDKT